MPALIDVTYGNISQAQADRMVRAATVPTVPPYPAGSTEPYVSELVASLLKATGIPCVLETGAFRGDTTLCLAKALEAMGGGQLLVAEIDPERQQHVINRLTELQLPENVQWTVVGGDALTLIRSLPDNCLGLAFIDDDHQIPHVSDEAAAIWPKLAPGGLAVFHDVFGVCNLRVVVESFGGYCLDLPRTGPAGGLGLLQKR